MGFGDGLDGMETTELSSEALRWVLVCIFVVLFLFYKIFFEFFLTTNATKYDPIISVYIATCNNDPSKIGPDEYLR